MMLPKQIQAEVERLMNMYKKGRWDYYMALAELGIVKTRIIKGKVFIETKHLLTLYK